MRASYAMKAYVISVLRYVIKMPHVEDSNKHVHVSGSHIGVMGVALGFDALLVERFEEHIDCFYGSM